MDYVILFFTIIAPFFAAWLTIRAQQDTLPRIFSWLGVAGFEVELNLTLVSSDKDMIALKLEVHSDDTFKVSDIKVLIAGKLTQPMNFMPTSIMRGKGQYETLFTLIRPDIPKPFPIEAIVEIVPGNGIKQTRVFRSKILFND